MGFIKSVRKSLQNTCVSTLNFFFDTNSKAEKVLWLAILIIGSMYASTLLYDQIILWDEDMTLMTKKIVPLGEVKFQRHFKFHFYSINVI